MMWSVVIICAGFLALVITQQSPPTLLVLAAANLIGAVSMLLAIQRDSKPIP